MITDRMKFFERSLTRFTLGVGASATSGEASARNVLTENRLTNWESFGSDDTREETITITFPSPVRANRLLLINHNLREFSISLSASTPITSFSNIRKQTVNSISETNNLLDTGYWSFDEAAVTSITIRGRRTIVPNAQKFIFQVVLTTELFTFSGWPEILKFPFSNNETKVKTKGGRFFINKQERVLEPLKMNFRGYTYIEDVNFVSTLFDRDNPFLFWPSGGYQQFRYPVEGWRLRDIYTMQTIGKYSSGLARGSYSGLINTQITLAESI